MSDILVCWLRGKRETRLLLWEDDPRCWWCREPTRISFERGEGGMVPPDAATLDHIYTFRDARRWGHADLVVLSCRRCNNERGSRTCEEMRLAVADRHYAVDASA